MGFRALKKTLEAPYTTKVNNRDRTSRGTTLFGSAKKKIFYRVSGQCSQLSAGDRQTASNEISILYNQ